MAIAIEIHDFEAQWLARGGLVGLVILQELHVLAAYETGLESVWIDGLIAFGHGIAATVVSRPQRGAPLSLLVEGLPRGAVQRRGNLPRQIAALVVAPIANADFSERVLATQIENAVRQDRDRLDLRRALKAGVPPCDTPLGRLIGHRPSTRDGDQ